MRVYRLPWLTNNRPDLSDEALHRSTEAQKEEFGFMETGYYKKIFKKKLLYSSFNKCISFKQALFGFDRLVSEP